MAAVICPAALPTPPAAAVISTVPPACSRPRSTRDFSCVGVVGGLMRRFAGIWQRVTLGAGCGRRFGARRLHAGHRAQRHFLEEDREYESEDRHADVGQEHEVYRVGEADLERVRQHPVDRVQERGVVQAARAALDLRELPGVRLCFCMASTSDCMFRPRPRPNTSM